TLQRGGEGRRLYEEHVRLQRDQFLRRYPRLICGAVGRKASVNGDIAALRPSTLFRRAAEQRDEVAPPHSITSSARASNVDGMLRPSAFAVIRFTIRSNLVGCWPGRSAGFAPRRILST